MAKGFEIALNAFRIQELAPDTVATEIETWIDGLSIGDSNDIVELASFMHQGFLWVAIVYLDSPSVTTLTWANATTTDVAPGTDTEINVERARSISIQVDSTDSNSTSTSIDINVESSPDGTNWDTTPFAEVNIGDAEIKTFLVEPGPKLIRLRLDVNNNRGDVTARVKVQKE